MRRTIQLQIRSIRALSARFLGAMIVEWWFPMHIDETRTRLHRTVQSNQRPANFTPPELENPFAAQRCTATSMAPSANLAGRRGTRTLSDPSAQFG